MKNINLKDKRLFIGVGLLIVVVLILLLLSNNNNSNKPKDNVKNNENLEETLKKLGSDFYEKFYYMQSGSTDDERKQYVKGYEVIGFRINLNTLKSYNDVDNSDIIKKFVNKKTGKTCDLENSNAVIYPKSPYSQKDFVVDAELVCE